jgi:hypothetical protein
MLVLPIFFSVINGLGILGSNDCIGLNISFQGHYEYNYRLKGTAYLYENVSYVGDIIATGR